MALSTKSLFIALCLLGLKIICGEEAPTPRSAPPEVKQTSGPRLVVPVGQDEVKLQCKVKNAQDYTWYKNGAQFSAPLPPRYTIKAYRFLEITNAVKSDSGLFFCVTSNNVGSANCSVELLVEDPTVTPTDITGVKPQFLYPKQMESVKAHYKEYDKLVFTCEANGVPRPVVTWYRDGKVYSGRHRSGHVITPGSYDYKIIFTEVDINDRGTYMCNVSNAYGWLNHTYTLFVEERVRSEPQIYFIWEQKSALYVGESVEIFCKVLTKDPKTKYRWYYSDSDSLDLGGLIDLRWYKQPPYIIEDDLTLAQITFTLRLENLTIDQSGFYGCQAENSAGNGSRQTEVTVVYRPVISVTTEEERSTTSMSTSDTVSTHLDVSDQEGVKPQIAESAWISGIQYLAPLIAVTVVVFIGLILAFTWMYWQIKKARQTSSRSRRPGIDSIQAKYEVKNEYVVVPDFK